MTPTEIIIELFVNGRKPLFESIALRNLDLCTRPLSDYVGNGMMYVGAVLKKYHQYFAVRVDMYKDNTNNKNPISLQNFVGRLFFKLNDPVFKWASHYQMYNLDFAWHDCGYPVFFTCYEVVEKLLDYAHSSVWYKLLWLTLDIQTMHSTLVLDDYTKNIILHFLRGNQPSLFEAYLKYKSHEKIEFDVVKYAELIRGLKERTGLHNIFVGRHGVRPISMDDLLFYLADFKKFRPLVSTSGELDFFDNLIKCGETHEIVSQ